MIDDTRLDERISSLRIEFRTLEQRIKGVEDTLTDRVKQELVPELDREIRGVQRGQDWNYSLGRIWIDVAASTYEGLTDRTLEDLPRFPNTISALVRLNLLRADCRITDYGEYTAIYSQIQPAVQQTLEDFRKRYSLDSVGLFKDSDDDLS